MEEVDKIRKALKGTPGCKIEIRAATNPQARRVAFKLAEIFGACGYAVIKVDEEEHDREGIKLESHTNNAEAALVVQSAFHTAGMDVTLLLERGGPRDVVRIYLGKDAL